MNHYYDAYDKRYQIIHKKGYSWSGDTPTPIVSDVIQKYSISKNASILETGCGEGRDAFSGKNTHFGVTAILCVLLVKPILILYANILKIRVNGIHPID